MHQFVKSGKVLLVLMESCAGTGHKFAAVRLKSADKAAMIRFDPWVQQRVLYKEKKKLKTL
uniref:Large ribosomal subunit protein bL33m n=1 Tax=Octopus bimaculoides TaxID=37653 RepID=A0A0L8GK65_OCTBM